MLKTPTRMQLNAYGNLSGSFMVVSEPEINMYIYIDQNVNSLWKGT